jgi:hypothetical protein
MMFFRTRTMMSRSVPVLMAVLLILVAGCSDDSNPVGFGSIEEEINNARPLSTVRAVNWRDDDTRTFERSDDFTEAVARDGQLVLLLGSGSTSIVRYAFNLQTAKGVEISGGSVTLTF